MDSQKLLASVEMLEELKVELRTAWESSGRQESVADHSWRLAMLAWIVASENEYDLLKVLKIALVHDAGEAYSGDVAAPLADDPEEKHRRERENAEKLFSMLPAERRSEMLSLMKEYNEGKTPEARLIKALDKLETIIQHNQGSTPADFDYDFNLTYGRALAAKVPELKEFRALIDEKTQRKIEEAGEKDES